VIYGGLAAEQFSGPIIDAFFMSLDSIVSQGMQSITQPAELAADDQNLVAR